MILSDDIFENDSISVMWDISHTGGYGSTANSIANTVTKVFIEWAQANQKEFTKMMGSLGIGIKRKWTKMINEHFQQVNLNTDFLYIIEPATRPFFGQPERPSRYYHFRVKVYDKHSKYQKNGYRTTITISIGDLYWQRLYKDLDPYIYNEFMCCPESHTNSYSKLNYIIAKSQNNGSTLG